MDRPRTTCCWCGETFSGKAYHSETDGDYCQAKCYEEMAKEQNERDEEENPDGEAEAWAEKTNEALSRYAGFAVQSYRRSRLRAATELPAGTAPSELGFSRASRRSWSSAVLK